MQINIPAIQAGKRHQMEMMMETFKDIPGYEGRYTISNKGRVRSEARTIKVTSFYSRTVLQRFMKLQYNSDGDQTIPLSKNNNRKIHRIKDLMRDVWCIDYKQDSK